MTRMFEGTGAGARPYVLHSLAMNLEIGNKYAEVKTKQSQTVHLKRFIHTMAHKSFYFAQGFYYENKFAEVVS